MKPVSLSEDNKPIELEEVIENDPNEKDLDPDIKSLKEVNIEMAKTLEELKTEKDALEAKVKTLTEAADEKNKEELEGLNKQLTELQTSIVKLEEAETAKVKADAEKEIGLTKKLADSEKTVLEQGKTIVTMGEDVKTLTDTVGKLMTERTELKGERHTSSMKDVVRELKDAGAFPATLKVIEPILLAEKAGEISITLTEGEGDKEKKITKSLADILKDVILSIPEEFRFTVSEDTTSVTSPTGSGKEMSEEEVDAYAAEKKITFAEALIQLSKAGKIA